MTTEPLLIGGGVVYGPPPTCALCGKRTTRDGHISLWANGHPRSGSWKFHRACLNDFEGVWSPVHGTATFDEYFAREEEKVSTDARSTSRAP